MLALARTILLFIPAVSVYTVFCGSLSLLLALVFRDGEPSHRVARFWARLILKTCRVRVEIGGREHLEPGNTYVLAANHQSLFDIPILFAHLPLSFRILYKQSLTSIPFLGWHLFLSGHVAVDRANPVRARRSLERSAERIRRGTSVVVFPEGTRSVDGSIGRFKYGSFALAVRAGVPVVPVTIAESWRIMKRGQVRVHPGTVRVVIDAPIPVEGFDGESVPELASRVRETIVGNYRPERHRPESPGALTSGETYGS